MFILSSALFVEVCYLFCNCLGTILLVETQICYMNSRQIGRGGLFAKVGCDGFVLSGGLQENVITCSCLLKYRSGGWRML